MKAQELYDLLTEIKNNGSEDILEDVKIDIVTPDYWFTDIEIKHEEYSDKIELTCVG